MGLFRFTRVTWVIAAALVGCLGIAAPAFGAPSPATFVPAPGSPVPVGSSPQAVATGDFNGDGKPDLAIANLGNNNVSVFLGNGNGSFAAAPGSPIAAGASPAALAAGDFNHDGRLDLVVVNEVSGNVTILLGNGDGTFNNAPGSPIPVGSLPFAVVAGDFRGGGGSDLAVANLLSGNVSILLGNGDGTFANAPGSPVAVGSLPISVAAGDFNGDGKRDLAVVNAASSNVSILLGNGGGTFMNAPGSPVPLGSEPSAVAAGDFNGDGRQDLAVSNVEGNGVSILLGNGNGTFSGAPGSPVPTGSEPQSVAPGDFNGDGIPDLAVTNISSNDVSILLGAGDGTFVSGSPIATGTGPFAVAVADFNLDGRPDLAISNEVDNSVSVELNTTSVGSAAGH